LLRLFLIETFELVKKRYKSAQGSKKKFQRVMSNAVNKVQGKFLFDSIENRNCDFESNISVCNQKM